MLHGTTKPQVTALRRTLTTCHANLAPASPDYRKLRWLTTRMRDLPGVRAAIGPAG